MTLQYRVKEDKDINISVIYINEENKVYSSLIYDASCKQFFI